MGELVKLNLESWKIRINENPRRNTMKIYIDLNKDESIAFKNFMMVVKPEEVGQRDFMRHIFFEGIEALKNKLVEGAKEYAEQHKEELASSGVDVETMFKDQNVEIVE